MDEVTLGSDRQRKLDDFVPYGPEIARNIAKKIKALWDSSPEYRRRQLRHMCKLCHDPKRELLDYMILIGSPHHQVCREISSGKYTGLQVVRHRDKHLLPLIRSELRPDVETLATIPYPKDGTLAERGFWYLGQLNGVKELALKEGKLNDAARALHEMYVIDKEMIGNQGGGGNHRTGLEGLLPSAAER
jgi:hypothetical protein